VLLDLFSFDFKIFPPSGIGFPFAGRYFFNFAMQYAVCFPAEPRNAAETAFA